VTPFDAAPFVLRLVIGTVAGLVTWIGAYGVGSLLFDALRIPRSLAGRAVFASAIGYAAIGTLVACAALFHGLGPPVALLVIGLAALELFEQRRAVPHLLSIARAAAARFAALSPLEKAATGTTAFAFAFAWIAAALPAVWWDPIAYHLPIAARALSQHAFVFDPAMTQTGFPLLGEAAALPAYAIAGSAGAATATLGSGIALALICGVWAERIAPGSGRLATALVACSALWLWLAPSFYVDVPFAMFAVAAIALPMLCGDGDAVPAGLAAAAGALAGAAAAIKYPGLVVTVVALTVVTVASRPSRRALSAAAFVGAAVVVAAGWYVRSAMAAGDPLYPFLTAHFGGPAHDFAVRYVQMTQQWCGGGTTISDLLMLPWRLLTVPQSFCGDPGYALDLGAIFAVAALAVWRRTAVPILAATALAVFWFYSSQQWRFLMPSVALFAVAAAVGATAATGRLRNLAHGILIALCAVGVIVDLLPGPSRDASDSIAPAYAYISGAQSGDDYLSSRLESYDAARWLRVIDGGVRAAALDDVRDYYFGASTVWFNPYYQSVWAIDWSAPADARYRAIARAGFRFLIVNANDAFVGRTPTGVDFRAVAEDERAGRIVKVFESDGVSIYRLSRPR
jgi:hypothetical protein